MDVEHKEYSLVYDRVYIGSIHSVKKDIIDKLGVGLVVKCDFETNITIDIDTEIIEKFEDLWVLKEDYPEIIQKVNTATVRMKTFIDENPGKSILVHCYGGQNRSALVIGAYLKKYHEIEYDEIISILETANATRGVQALWNPHFRNILRDHI